MSILSSYYGSDAKGIAELNSDLFVVEFLFAAMIEREHSIFEGPDDLYAEYKAIESYLERDFPEVTKHLRLQHNAKSGIPF